MKKIITETEVDKEFELFLTNCHRCKTEDDKKLLRKAYKFAKIAHKGQTRYNGDAFISHPVEVAKIVTQDIGLSTTSAISALLHDIFANTDTDEAALKISFGQKKSKEIIYLVNKLTKIKGTANYFDTNKLSVYQKFIESLSEDIRIIYIKIADRLHNMRTLYALEPQRKLKTANETMNIYAPLANRLGLYNIKTELQDLAFKYLQNKNYTDISTKIKYDKRTNIMYLNKFSLPIIAKLSAAKFNFDIKSRQKSIYSIWQKIIRKKITFEEVYDIFAMRIIFIPKSKKNQKQECLEIAELIKQIYEIKPDRTRNWIDTPKANGYSALHITAKAPNGKWIEIQIRSKEMNDIAEYGLAAHWKYKGLTEQKEEFTKKIETLKRKFENIDDDEINYSKDFKLLFTTEIYTYTPKGREITLDIGATVLDFAFALHSTLGFKCIGAKVNNKLKPIDHKLQSGDEVLIMTLKKQEPKTQWLKIVKTRKAKNKLRQYLKNQLFDEKENGQQILNKILKQQKIQPSSELFNSLRNTLKLNKQNIYINIGNGKISEEQLKLAIKKFNRKKLRNFFKITTNTEQTNINIDELKTAKCCNPIPGDKITGIENNNEIIIHKENCEKIKNQKKFKLTWQTYLAKSYYARLEIDANNQIGILQKIINTLANDLEINIKSFHFETLENEFLFSGWLEIYVININHLKKIIKKISKIDGITKVERI